VCYSQARLEQGEAEGEHPRDLPPVLRG
jgi:hypothetical protein